METVKEIAQRLRTSLSSIYSERESEQIIRILFKEYAGWDAATVVLNYHDHADMDLIARLERAQKRLLHGEPLQYIIGATDFFGLRFRVGKGVLIPRPETEELVGHVLNYISRTGSSRPGILDIGTGSGCIAIALKKHVPNAIVEAIDHSHEALEFANENARLNHVDITFRHGDVLSMQGDLITGHYEIIVSNPPYIPMSEKSTMHQNIVDFEPDSALFISDEDPLVFYRSIAAIASRHLKKPGYLIAEIHESFGAEIYQMFRNEGFDGAEILQDINGKWRFVSVIHQ